MIDVILRNGTLFDGSGKSPSVGDVALKGDTVVSVGSPVAGEGRIEIDAKGLAVCPGFINMLSWATESLLYDGRSMSDIHQGVTLEVFGEGRSMGPLTDRMKRESQERQDDFRYDIEWTTLGEYLQHLEDRGVCPNVASFVGATTLRIHEIGYENRPPSKREMIRMEALVREAMEEGALGVGSSLIYTPAAFAATEELINLSKAAAPYSGLYITHLRSEANRLLEGVEEVITIAREAGIRAEIYHLKAAGPKNHSKLEAVMERIETARKEGLKITANMYPYTAGATALDTTMPPWVQEGGLKEWIGRLKTPSVRERVIREMRSNSEDWENLLALAGAENIVLGGFKNPDLRDLVGKTLAEVAGKRGVSPEETAMDLVVEDHSPVTATFFLMSEENVRRKLGLDWVSFGSDAESMAAEGKFLTRHPHPRAYGTFARVLGRYVRDERIVSLEEAIRRLTSLPAENLGLTDRGRLTEGYKADVVVFDPGAVRDNATYEDPHQYSTGVVHVFVNGVQVLKDGRHTGALPGRFVRGPGAMSLS
ncbi:MAG: amidohydrolase family protein [Fidelibacterota bacterium]